MFNVQQGQAPATEREKDMACFTGTPVMVQRAMGTQEWTLWFKAAVANAPHFDYGYNDDGSVKS